MHLLERHHPDALRTLVDLLGKHGLASPMLHFGEARIRGSSGLASFDDLLGAVKGTHPWPIEGFENAPPVVAPATELTERVVPSDEVLVPVQAFALAVGDSIKQDFRGKGKKLTPDVRLYGAYLGAQWYLKIEAKSRPVIRQRGGPTLAERAIDLVGSRYGYTAEFTRKVIKRARRTMNPRLKKSIEGTNPEALWQEYQHPEDPRFHVPHVRPTVVGIGPPERRRALGMPPVRPSTWGT